MKGKTKKIVLAVAVIGAVAAGGVAFTDANVVPNSMAGYKDTTVSGATATAVNYTLNSDGTNIDAVAVTFSTTITGKHVRIAFNNGTLTPDCTITGSAGSQVATCSGLTQATDTATHLAVTVND